jgi:hypothetical protein
MTARHRTKDKELFLSKTGIEIQNFSEPVPILEGVRHLKARRGRGKKKLEENS